MAGSRHAPSFTDRGKTVDIHESRSRESVHAALQLSAHKWGTISVRGDEAFKRTCVELAAEHGFKITNPELQQAIAAEREHRMSSTRTAHPEFSLARREQSMTRAAIYSRHVDSIVREHPWRRADPSRLDGEVAARMAVTGHSREQIKDAIKIGASADRPGETRDWDLYALRATNFAFSPPGRAMQDRLAEQRPRLLRLEGRQDDLDILRGLGAPLRGL